MIETERDGDLWTVRLNRPDKANSVTRAMLEGVAEFAEEAQGRAKVIVLTGAGKVFSAGMDLEAAKSGLPTDPVWERVSAAIAAFQGLSIAALNGTLAGGSMGMALACDLRVAVEGAKLFYPVMSLGFLPQPSDPGRLATLVGPSRAKMILMAGQKIPVAEALSWGLVDRVVAKEDLEGCVRDLAAAALGAEPSHISGIKSLIA
ncbi:enoyl-CoA hydratase/isomerase family protein [Mangrovicoccus sp. HB161399]|uniref:enoyl-CoA hydratase/isomerase family protein n=1 Tax=Mangrovicoccus sp. HB161399 TaxID=2720392 RepID=UPI0015548DDD|nr:enoyl-CoA hydratase/isomerase family protein [Mangrovicoccus sp. HB161399]